MLLTGMMVLVAISRRSGIFQFLAFWFGSILICQAYVWLRYFWF